MKNQFQRLPVALFLCLLISCSKGSDDSVYNEPPTVLPQGPSGDICFFNTPDFQTFELISMKYDGTESKVVLKDNSPTFAYYNEWTKWSFDKSKIIFASARDGSTTSDVYIINKDGSGLTNITNSPTIAETFPSLSPDGQTVLFTARDENYNRQLYTCTTDGSNVKQLTHFTHPSRKVASVRAVWAKQGNTIYFNSNKDTTAYNIYAIKADGSQLRRITTSTASSDCGPAVSMDGKKIVFYANDNAVACLFTINADGTNKKQVTTFDAGDPVWSPDGSRLAFVSDIDKGGDRNEGYDIYTIKADGTDLQRLTNTKGEKWFIDWK